MAKINILDSSIFNLISAGEVVENPSSVVKELLENSIDSGASEISIAIEDGGIKSISVVDNGCGIECEEIEKTVLPHATSKISSAKDLLTIGTLGFRGEALASIAMVSEFCIKSKFIENDKAYAMEVVGGKSSDIVATNLLQGTSITVKNLFFNTPVRYKFLKSASGELALITNLVKNFIFSNPDISFKYSVDSKIILQTNGDGLENGIYSVFEPSIANNLIPIEYDNHNYKITGYIGKPASNAIVNNRNKQIFVINGRVISDNELSCVVQNAYGEYLMKRTFPIFILDILLPFDMVDVNVHPNKKEVRFANKKAVNGVIYNAVKQSLNKNYVSMQNELKESLFTIKPSNESDNLDEKQFVNNENAANQNQNNKINTDIKQEEFKINNQIVENWGKNDIDTLPITNIKFSNGITNFADSNLNDKIFVEKSIEKQINKVIYKIIGQLFDTYILIECNDRLLIVDQHATHERIIFDKLIKESEGNIDMQQLLFPYSVNLENDELAGIEKQLDNINKLGFQMEILGNKLTLNAIPYMLIDMDISEFVRDVVAEIKEINLISSLPQVRIKLAKMSCKKAIKGGDKLNSDQLDYVVNYFFNNNNIALQCPHGRPTVIFVSRTEIEKMFRRIV